MSKYNLTYMTLQKVDFQVGTYLFIDSLELLQSSFGMQC